LSDFLHGNKVSKIDTFNCRCGDDFCKGFIFRFLLAICVHVIPLEISPVKLEEITMKRALICLPYLPHFTTLSICGLLVAHGPITQLAHYHEFANQVTFMGLPRAADVLSNLGFALVAMWGMLKLWPIRDHQHIQAGRHGYVLFLFGLLLTVLGSSFYHLAPDNARLVWDRLPIALACAGLLAAVRAENVPNARSSIDAILLGLFAIVSVAWWRITDVYANGDLRLYLLLQGLPLILIPMWQSIYRAPLMDRLAFGFALLLYIVAKGAEIMDHQLFTSFGVISGHTLKHLLAGGAAGVLIGRLVQRTRK
jgi:hypothetical protein